VGFFVSFRISSFISRLIYLISSTIEVSRSAAGGAWFRVEEPEKNFSMQDFDLSLFVEGVF
jgi:hypothetical protein